MLTCHGVVGSLLGEAAVDDKGDAFQGDGRLCYVGCHHHLHQISGHLPWDLDILSDLSSGGMQLSTSSGARCQIW